MEGKVSNSVIYGKWQGFILSDRKRWIKKKDYAATTVQWAVKYGQYDWRMWSCMKN